MTIWYLYIFIYRCYVIYLEFEVYFFKGVLFQKWLVDVFGVPVAKLRKVSLLFCLSRISLMAMLTIEWQSSAHPEKRPSEVPKTRHLTPMWNVVCNNSLLYLHLWRGQSKKLRPLTRQLTNLAGNLWNASFLGSGQKTHETEDKLEVFHTIH